MIRKGEIDFDRAVLGTSFNKRDPGRRPDVFVKAANVEDVIAAVKLAVKEKMKIAVCSGGHSWSQNHIRDGGVLIDVSRLNELKVDRANASAVAGPGCPGSVAANALLKEGFFFPAGHCRGVCLGGYLLQGGFGWHGREYGMACEHVTALDLVTADGTLVHASETENADLYWAARGAGAGFFCVVVRFYLRLHPRPRTIGMAGQIFRMKHLEEVFLWAERAGANVPRSVEFQMLLTNRAFGIFAPGIEVAAPVFADSAKEAREAVSFLRESPLRTKASISMPFVPLPLSFLYSGVMSHYPEGHRWFVDNMWTGAPVKDLLPHLRRIVDTMPPPPSHALWLNWAPPGARPGMAFSVEARSYLALYGAWKNPADDDAYGPWAVENMRKMESFSSGIQLADENLGERPARFVSDANLARLDEIRSARDPDHRFHSWQGRPDRLQNE